MSSIKEQFVKLEQALKDGTVEISVTYIVVLLYSLLITSILILILLVAFIVGMVLVIPAAVLDTLFGFIRRLIWRK